MIKRTVNYTQLALDIYRGGWLLRDAEAFVPMAKRFLDHQMIAETSPEFRPMLADENGDVCDFESEDDVKTKEKKCAIIPMHNTLTKYDSCYTDGAVRIARLIEECADDDSIIGVVIDMDCPGGSSNAVYPIINAIRKVQVAGKPIVVHGDQVASAAYWIASQCDNIYLDNPMSEAGSIGAYISCVDNRTGEDGEKLITIYAVESPDKNKWYRDALEGKFEQAQKELSELVANFQAAVKAGRPSLKADTEGVMTGAMFATDKAVACGLADGQMSLADTIQNVFTRAEFL